MFSTPLLWVLTSGEGHEEGRGVERKTDAGAGGEVEASPLPLPLTQKPVSSCSLVGFINQEMDSLETWAHVEKHLTSARNKEGLRT